METLLVANDLHCHKNSGFVIDTAHDLTEAAFAEKVDDLISVGQVVSFHNVIVTSFVIVAKVGRRRSQVTNDFAGVQCTGEVDVGVVNNFAALEDIQVEYARSCAM